MALPTTITGISTSVRCSGPFISSAGNVYFIAKDASTAALLQAFKATDPTSSFASAGSNSCTQAIVRIAACQAGDTIHIAILTNNGGSIALLYRTFDMSSDAFVLSEAVHSGFDSSTSTSSTAWHCAIVYRTSDSQPLIVYQGPKVANMGSSYAKIVYAVRTGTNTWSNNQGPIDAGGTIDYTGASAILGSSNRTHTFFAGSNTTSFVQRTITSANALGTANVSGQNARRAPVAPVSYDSSGTWTIALLASPYSSGQVATTSFASADSPPSLDTTPTLGGNSSAAFLVASLFNDGADLWALYREYPDSDLYVVKSTNNAVSWGSRASAFVGTVSDTTDSLSSNGNIFERGGNFVIPYVVNDNGTLKYNEYIVRAGFSGHVCLANDVKSNSSVTTAAITQVHAPLANDVKSNSSVSQPVLGIRRDCLANDVLSNSSVTTPTATIRRDALANDVKSNSSVTNPAVQQRQALLANDVLSPSSVTQPAVKALHGLLANDIKSNSSVTTPTAAEISNAIACLANDVKSNSSVTQPAAVIRRDALANDVKSNSSVTQPAAIIGRTLLANDVLSPSSVSQPAAVIQRAILANDVTSPSKVGNPIVGIVGVIDARDITSASSVGQPAVHQTQGVLANDVKSPSAVTQPAALISRNLLANDALSASSVTKPAAGQITAGQPLANDIVSQSSVSGPTLTVVGVQPPIVVQPVPPAHGGGAGYIGAKQRQLLSETVERAYRKALKLDEREVVEAIRTAVKEAVPERRAQRLRTDDFERLVGNLSAVRGLLEKIERQAKAIEIQSALDALIAYEIALEEDDMEVLLIAA